MAGKRNYDDPCGIARALDVVGERWALLVVRELLLGPKRFTDLSRGLPGSSQNVLSHRLRELEQAEVVTRRKLGPPASTWVYELTDQGHDLEPVLLQLGRWGSRTRMTTTAELSVDALVIALKTMFDSRAAGEQVASYELRLGEDSFRVEVIDGSLGITRGRAETPDAVIEADAATLREFVFGDLKLSSALRSGKLKFEGDRQAAKRFAGLFARPAPRPIPGG